MSCKCSRYANLPCINGITQEDMLCDRCRTRVCTAWLEGTNRVQDDFEGKYTAEQMVRILECIYGSHQPMEEDENGDTKS